MGEHYKPWPEQPPNNHPGPFWGSCGLCPVLAGRPCHRISCVGGTGPLGLSPARSALRSGGSGSLHSRPTVKRSCPVTDTPSHADVSAFRRAPSCGGRSSVSDLQYALARLRPWHIRRAGCCHRLAADGDAGQGVLGGELACLVRPVASPVIAAPYRLAATAWARKWVDAEITAHAVAGRSWAEADAHDWLVVRRHRAPMTLIALTYTKDHPARLR